MARKPPRQSVDSNSGGVDAVAIMISADSPDALIARIGQWCGAKTGWLSRSPRGAGQVISHELAIHISPGRDAKSTRFIAVLTPKDPRK